MATGAPRVRLAVEPAARATALRAEVRRRANAMMRALQLVNEEVSIVLTGDDQIQNLNKIYRHKDRPTDVLAFAQREGEHARMAGDLLGDVVISVPTARRQASANGRPLIDEVAMLVAHGILHLLGWDHDTAAKDRRMRAETKRLCDAAASRAKGRGGVHVKRRRTLFL